MAEYTGVNAPAVAVQLNPTSYRKGLIKSSNLRFSSALKHGGSFSLEISPGGYKELFFASNAGSTTVTAWVYPEAGANASLEVEELGAGEKLDIASSVGHNAWEQLSITWTAEKKIYVIRIANNARDDEATTKGFAYFDDLV